MDAYHGLFTFRLAERMRVTCDVLAENLPSEFTFERPQGGYFIWIEGPEGFKAQEFKCKDVVIMPGIKASGNRENPSDICARSFRISIAYYQSHELSGAVAKLCQALRESSIQ